MGYETLRNPHVAAAVAELLEAEGITPDRIKIHLAAIFFGSDLADFSPYLTGEKTLDELRADGVNASLVKRARARAHDTSRKDEQTTTTIREIELHDRLAAVRELNRVLGIVSEKREIRGGMGLLDTKNISIEELKRLAHATDMDVEILMGECALPRARTGV